MADFTAKTVWNLDDARFKAIDYYLNLCEACFISWDLENMYIYLQQIRRMISGKINIIQFDETGKSLQEIEELRQSINTADDDEFPKIKHEIYQKCDKLYVYLNRLMVKHGLFFKEGDDPTRAALKR